MRENNYNMPIFDKNIYADTSYIIMLHVCESFESSLDKSPFIDDNGSHLGELKAEFKTI